MAALIRQLVQICLMQGGPQDLPCSPRLTVMAVAALMSLQMLAVVARDRGVDYLLASLAVIVVMLLLVTPQLLRLRGLPERTPQTVLAQAGCGVLLTLVVLPLLLAQDALVAFDPPSPAALPVSLLVLLVWLWKLRVDAAIWRHALELRPVPALLLAIGLVVAQILMLTALLPPVPIPET